MAVAAALARLSAREATCALERAKQETIHAIGTKKTTTSAPAKKLLLYVTKLLPEFFMVITDQSRISPSSLVMPIDRLPTSLA